MNHAEIIAEKRADEARTEAANQAALDAYEYDLDEVRRLVPTALEAAPAVVRLAAVQAFADALNVEV